MDGQEVRVDAPSSPAKGNQGEAEPLALPPWLDKATG